MEPRERALTLLKGGQPDCVPWFGDLDYWASALISRGERPEDFKLSGGYLDWHRDLGVGFYLQGPEPFRPVPHGYTVRRWREGLDDFREIRTPRGTLRECWRDIPGSFTIAPVEHLIKSVDDLPAYRFIHENTTYEPEGTVLELRRRQIGGQGLLLAYLPKSPLMQLVALDAGIMAVAEIHAEDRDGLEATLAIMAESQAAAARLAVESTAEVLMIPENLSAEMIGRNWFNAYLRPWQERWAAEARKAGKFSCIHMDGTLRGLLREECTVGLTFLEALTPAPVGDVAVEEWESFRGGNDVVFWGGLPGVYFSPTVPDREFNRHLLATLEVMRREPRYVLGVADQVPPDVVEDRVRRVAGLVEEYGRY